MALLALLYGANLPVYAGASVGEHFSWRMEHGRLTLQASPVAHHEDFYIAPNSEGLRFGFAGHFQGTDSWSLTVPLWAPLLLSGAWAVWAWRSRRPAQP